MATLIITHPTGHQHGEGSVQDVGALEHSSDLVSLEAHLHQGRLHIHGGPVTRQQMIRTAPGQSSADLNTSWGCDISGFEQDSDSGVLCLCAARRDEKHWRQKRR